MALSSFSIALFFVFVFFTGYTLTKEVKLTPFGKKVKSLMPEETYKKVFAVNVKDDDELKEALKVGSKNYADKLGLPYDESVEKEDEKENEKLGIKNIDSDKLFHAQTYAIAKVFREKKILNSENMDQLAQEYVDEFNKVSKNLTKDDVSSTFTAMTTAVANFLISQNQTSAKTVKKLENAFLEELKEYEE